MAVGLFRQQPVNKGLTGLRIHGWTFVFADQHDAIGVKQIFISFN